MIRCWNCPISASAGAGSRGRRTSGCAVSPAPARSRSTHMVASCASCRVGRGRAGDDVVLGLDIAMQEFVARRVEREPSVACVLLDAANGDVLAMLSSPSFDPMQFSTGLTHAAWQELSTDERHPLIDKAAAGVYPPGSTFKPVVALAALEAGVITPETPITCPGHVRPRQCDLSLLAKRRAWHAAAARGDQAVLRRVLLRDGAAARHRASCRDGAPLRLRPSARPRNPRRARRVDPEPRVETANRWRCVVRLARR